MGMSYCMKRGTHIRVSELISKFPAKVQKIIEFLLDILILVVFVWLVYAGMKYVVFASASNAYTIPLNKGVIVAIIPICSVLMVIRTIEKLVKQFLQIISERRTV